MYKRRYRRGRKTALKRVMSGARKVSTLNKKAKVINVVAVARSLARFKKEVRKDVEMKKWSPTSMIAGLVGQVNGNGTAAYVADLDILNTGQSVDQDDRIGVKVNLKGIHLRCQLQQQSNAQIPMKCIVEIWKTADFGGSLNSIRDSIFAVDSISGVVDINSTKNPEYLGIYKCIASKTVWLAGDNPSTSLTMVKDFKMFIKQRQMLSYAGASATVPQNVRYFMTIRASNGNISSNTISTLSSIPVVAQSSGAIIRYQTTAYYTDN